MDRRSFLKGAVAVASCAALPVAALAKAAPVFVGGDDVWHHVVKETHDYTIDFWFKSDVPVPLDQVVRTDKGAVIEIGSFEEGAQFYIDGLEIHRVGPKTLPYRCCINAGDVITIDL